MAFTGKAVYSDFRSAAEDVADYITIISPSETPLLDYLGDATYAGENLLHEFLEDSLSPNTIVASSNVASNVTGGDVIGIAGGNAPLLQVGMILIGPSASGSEYMVITAIAGNSITVSRAQGSTVANSFAAGQSLSVLGDAALEGDDVTQNTATVKVRNFNYMQIIKKDIIISGSELAVTHLGGITNAYDYEKNKKTREALRDLEKLVIMGVLFGNTIGTATARRTMRGVRASITTNVQSVGQTLTESWLGTAIQNAWNNGGTDIDLIYAGANYKRIIDTFNGARKLIANTDSAFRNVVDVYESTFGTQRIMLSRWMPTNEALILASSRVKVIPLAGRTFQHLEVARTGDSQKGMVLGEYTVEVHNEAGLSRIV